MFIITGQMLLNWISTSLQVTSLNLNENDLNLLSLQYCTNLLVLGILKQIPDKLAPTQQIFKVHPKYSKFSRIINFFIYLA